MQKSVVHLSFSSAGGAGGVARILSEAQSSSGRPSWLVTHISSSLRAQPFSAPLHTIAAGIDEYFVKNKEFDAPISLYRDRIASGVAEAVKGADIIHLHGINGLIDLDRLVPLLGGKAVVWTLHDMNPLTGVCHYSLGCEGFTRGCSSCPAVKSGWQPSVEKRFQQKAQSLALLPKLRLVTPSDWLRAQVEASPVTKQNKVSVIPNPVRPEFFAQSTPPRSAPRRGLHVVVVAQNLDDPVKNVALAVESFLVAKATNPGLHLTLVGRGGDRFEGPGISTMTASSGTEMMEVLDHGDVLVVPSEAENAPLVIAEAASRGCSSLVRNVGGMPEMIERLGIGRVFESGAELSDLLARNSWSKRTRSSLMVTARKIYSPGAAVDAYDKVYEEVVQHRPPRRSR